MSDSTPGAVIEELIESPRNKHKVKKSEKCPEIGPVRKIPDINLEEADHSSILDEQFEVSIKSEKPQGMVKTQKSHFIGRLGSNLLSVNTEQSLGISPVIRKETTLAVPNKQESFAKKNRHSQLLRDQKPSFLTTPEE